MKKKIMLFLLSTSMVVSVCPVISTAASAEPIIIQAEEISAFGHYVDGVMTKVERDAGAQSFGGSFIQQATNGADAMAWIYDNTTTPEHGETGDGMQVASWGNKFYAIKIRGTNNTAANVVNELYYTIDAPYAGDYTFDIYGYTVWNPTLSIYVNNAADAVNVTGLNYYNDGSDTRNVDVKSGSATLTLAKGENTIRMSLNGQTAVFDKFELSFAGEIPDGPGETEAPDMPDKPLTDTMIVQAEELSAFGHYADGVMTKVERDAGAQSFGGSFIQQATGGADAMAWIYSNDAAPEHGETGDGMQVASWGYKFYAIKIRGTNNTAANVVNELYYTINAPYAGDYTFDIYGYTVWNPTLSIYVNDAADAVNVTGLNYYNDGSDARNVDVKSGSTTLTLAKGENTIRMSLNGQTAVFDKFELTFAGEIPEGPEETEVPTNVPSIAPTEAPTVVPTDIPQETATSTPLPEGIILQAEEPADKYVDTEKHVYDYGTWSVTIDHTGRALAADGLQHTGAGEINFAHLDRYEYTFEVEQSGVYSLSVYALCDRDAPIAFSINGGPLQVGTMTRVDNEQYDKGEGWTLHELGNVDLNKGENTLSLTITDEKNYNVRTDYYLLTPASGIEIPSVGTSFRIESEDFTSYVNHGVMYSARSVLPEAVAGQSAWGTGDGDVKSVYTGRNTSFGDIYFTYKVEVQTAGEYSIVLNANVQSWRTGRMRPVVTVNGEDAITFDDYVTGLNGPPASSNQEFANDFYKTKLGTITLVEGINTITIGTRRDDDESHNVYGENGIIFDYVDFEYDLGHAISREGSTEIAAMEYDKSRSHDNAPEGVWAVTPFQSSPDDTTFAAILRNADTIVYKVTAAKGDYDVYVNYFYTGGGSEMTMQLGDGEPVTGMLSSTTDDWANQVYGNAKAGTLSADSGTQYFSVSVSRDMFIHSFTFVPVEQTGYTVKTEDTFIYNGEEIDSFSIKPGDVVGGFVTLTAGSAGDAAEIYLALYDEKGILKGLKNKVLSTDGKTAGTSVEALIEITAGEGVTEAKMFVIREGTLTPSCDAFCSKND